MKKIISTLLLAGCCLTSLMAQDVVVKGPDEKLQLVVFTSPTEKHSTGGWLLSDFADGTRRGRERTG